MIPEAFWWTALAVASLSALAHLFTMLGTRWGDQKASVKALGFSLLFHLALISALFAVGPKIEEIVMGDPRPIPEKDEPIPIQLRELAAEADQPRPAKEEGNVPVWNQPSENMVSPVDRSNRDATLSAIEPANRRDQTPAIRPSNIPPAQTLSAIPETPGPNNVEFPLEQSLLPSVAPPKINAESTPTPRTEKQPSLARTERSDEFAPGAAEPIPKFPRPETAKQPTPDIDPLKSLANLRGRDEPAILPETASTTDGMLIRRPSTPAALPNPKIASDFKQARRSAGEARMSAPLGRSPRPGDGIPSQAPELERGTASAAPKETPGTDPKPGSLAPLDPSGQDVPSLARIDDSAPITLGGERPETYQLRALDKRGEIARKNGGTKGSEQAVERSLAWLASHQTAWGYWDADEYGAGQVGIDEEGVDREHAGKTADAGVTALAILAFLGAGYTREEGKYTETVGDAIDWLLEIQRDDGYLGGNAAHFEKMYCHGMATYALAEAYGMEKNPADSKLRRPVIDAVVYISLQQGEDGGWRYVKGQKGDMSMFGWQCMALKSAAIAGIPIPRSTKSRMIDFLQERSLGDYGGLAGYRAETPATPSMTAEALFCKQMLGISRTNPQSQEAVAYLLQHLPRRSKLNLYYYYYGTLAMFQYGGQPWERWNEAMRDLLIAEQIREGEHTGSWAPKGVWGPYGGRVYSTATATLCLEVYYRFLPLYRDAGQE